MYFAPVLILTLNRDEHFIKCIESLKKCTHAQQTDLIIALDYPFKAEHWDGYNKIKDYINAITGFKEVKIIERTENYGEVKNSVLSQEYVLSQYDRLIYTEDDNEFSTNFLDYLNKGLDRFKTDTSVAAICSLGSIIQAPMDYPNFMYIRGFSAWGFATWKDRLGRQYFSETDLNRLWNDRGIRRRVKKTSHICYYSLLQHVYFNKDMTGDAAISLDLAINGRCCIYPTISKVRNFGHDGSGIHGGNRDDSIYRQLELDPEDSFKFSEFNAKTNKKLERIIRAHDHYTLAKQFKMLIKYRLPVIYRKA